MSTTLAGNNGTSFWKEESTEVDTMTELEEFKNRIVYFNDVKTIGTELEHCKNGGRLYTLVPWDEKPPHELFSNLAYFCCSSPHTQALLDGDGGPFKFPAGKSKGKTPSRRLFVWINTTDTVKTHVIQCALSGMTNTQWLFEIHANRKLVGFKPPRGHDKD